MRLESVNNLQSTHHQNNRYTELLLERHLQGVQERQWGTQGREIGKDTETCLGEVENRAVDAHRCSRKRKLPRTTDGLAGEDVHKN